MKQLGVKSINKISRHSLQEMLLACKEAGHDVVMSDILYVAALYFFENKAVVYAVLHGRDGAEELVKNYDNTSKIEFLKEYIQQHHIYEENSDDDGDLSFAENKEALIKLLDKVQALAASGEIDKKDAVKLETDIRTKLNDKFSVSEKQEEQRVIVYKKYTDICKCGREIYRPTRDDIIEDLQQEYDLVPKKKESGNE